jgi:hypothetical protein
VNGQRLAVVARPHGAAQVQGNTGIHV